MRRFGWKPGQTGLVFRVHRGFRWYTRNRIRRPVGRLAAKPRLLRCRREGGAAGWRLRPSRSLSHSPLVSTAAVLAMLIRSRDLSLQCALRRGTAAIQQMMPSIHAIAGLGTLSVRDQSDRHGAWSLGSWPLFTDALFGDPKAIGFSLLVVGVPFRFLRAPDLLGLKPYRRSLVYLKEWTVGHP